jgi:predicted nucleic acid-binding protein
LILLDTVVVSEPLRLAGDPRVTAWLDAQPAETLYLSATSLSELLLGIEMMPAGQRRETLSAALRALLEKLFGGRLLVFDAAAANAYAILVGRARAAGRAISVPDGQIAATASVHGFAVATRDIGPFEAAGVAVINPWASQGPQATSPG